jgi:DNA adenine methylase
MMNNMNYTGGKNGSGVYQTIINHIPIHRVYVEGFLGSGAIMRKKFPAEINIGIEKNSDIAGKYGSMIQRKVGASCEIINDDFLIWLDKNSGRICKDWFIYLDPPYLMSVRSAKRRYYQVEMVEDKEHLALLASIKNLDCKVMISGYWSELYRYELDGWNYYEYTAVDRAGKKRLEVIWFNYSVVGRMNELTFLGDNYRERENIKRQVLRWMDKGYSEYQIKAWLASKKSVIPGKQLKLF